jgi:hypothetical protein
VPIINLAFEEGVANEEHPVSVIQREPRWLGGRQGGDTTAHAEDQDAKPKANSLTEEHGQGWREIADPGKQERRDAPS